MKKSDRILVTGGNGFLGRRIVAELNKQGFNKLFVPNSSTDLRDQKEVNRLFEGTYPDVVIHAAARVGGIKANLEAPATVFYDNAIMGINVAKTALIHGIDKFVQIGSACAYPGNAPVPTAEWQLWDGYPEVSNGSYGIAKRMMQTYGAALRKQFNFNFIYLILTNLYGPGDNFEPATSHVIPAMIRKFIEAKAQNRGTVELWGSGQVTRDFLYVGDAAEGIVAATHIYDDEQPVNLGSGREYRIAAIATCIAKIVGFEGDILFNNEVANGQERRVLDVSRAKAEFNWEAKTNFIEGLQKTVDWWRESNGETV